MTDTAQFPAPDGSSNAAEAGSQQPPLLEKRSDQAPLNRTVRHTVSGPRTVQGKRRTRLNAVKHGALAKLVLLDGESQDKFRTLSIGLHRHFKPVGEMEYILVDELVIAVWRKRRLVAAEAGTISEELFSIETKMRAKQAAEALQISRDAMFSGGLLAHDDNPFVIEEILSAWELFRQLVVKVELAQCTSLLDRLYGVNRYGKVPEQFRQSFQNYCEAMKLGSTESDSLKLAEMMQLVIETIDSEIVRFSELRESRAKIDHQKFLFKKLAGAIPCGGRADLLLRYETHLSREIDRILGRLERLQRMRKGQPLLPQLDLKIS